MNATKSFWVGLALVVLGFLSAVSINAGYTASWDNLNPFLTVLAWGGIGGGLVVWGLSVAKGLKK